MSGDLDTRRDILSGAGGELFLVAAGFSREADTGVLEYRGVLGVVGTLVLGLRENFMVVGVMKFGDLDLRESCVLRGVSCEGGGEVPSLGLCLGS